MFDAHARALRIMNFTASSKIILILILTHTVIVYLLLMLSMFHFAGGTSN